MLQMRIKIIISRKHSFIAGKHSTIKHNTTLHSSVQCNTTQHGTTQHNTVQYSTAQYRTVQYTTAQNNTVRYNTVRYNTVYLFKFLDVHRISCSSLTCVSVLMVPYLFKKSSRSRNSSLCMKLRSEYSSGILF